MDPLKLSFLGPQRQPIRFGSILLTRTHPHGSSSSFTRPYKWSHDSTIATLMSCNSRKKMKFWCHQNHGFS